ncbi:MAG: chromosome segregation protein SMC [Betaproteobacteria bacterium]|nr:chromosome segregation protein SMC [Betaproteobacteria bacterium]
MRLTKLKLAGFKSFVDPTSVHFPGALVGVVGPNGCGKSNIIDAVRWVLGESRASALRGESMQDVIFNGSTQRKPVGRASVELVFDNDQGRVGGQWSQYGEISVKRVLTREGESSYHINNIHVRRRDVVDLFLGTGLGPRAYAIIEQGMISRIIEARPEDLRLFLEEAAGITKYKERRRETENRLEDARENLFRVEDIRTELDGRILRLEGQAEVARRYRELQSRLTQRQNLLWLVRRNSARIDAERMAREVEKAITRLEAETANLRELERRAEQARERHYAAGDAQHAGQGNLYAANAEVAQLEAELRRLRESRQRLDGRLAQLGAEAGRWREQLTGAEAEMERWREMLLGAVERVAVTQGRHEEMQDRVPDLEAFHHQAQDKSLALRRDLAHAEQQLRVSEAHGVNAVRSLDALDQRRVRLADEMTGLETPDEMTLARLESEALVLDDRLAEQQSGLDAGQQQVPGLREQQRRAIEEERLAQRALTETRARHDALTQLQLRVQGSGKLGEWLRRHRLDERSPLWRVLHVEPGWETALESVLRERLAAVWAAHAEEAEQVLGDASPASFALAFAQSSPGSLATVSALEGAVPLLAYLRCEDAGWQTVLADWLASVFATENLPEVMYRRDELAPGELWVNRAGHCISRHHLGLFAPESQTHGLLERQQEIDALALRMRGLEADLARARARVAECEQAVSAAQEAMAELRRAVDLLGQQRHAVQLEMMRIDQARQRHRERRAQIERDMEEVERSAQDASLLVEQARLDATRHRELADRLHDELDQALEEERQRDAHLREVRDAAQRAAREAQEAQFSERECSGKLQELERTVAMAGGQCRRLDGELEEARRELACIDESAIEESLQDALVRRQAAEEALTACRGEAESATAQLRSLDEERLRTEQGLDPLRERIGELRLKHQAAQLNVEQAQARLDEAGADEQVLGHLLRQDLQEKGLQSEIDRLARDIADLGAVNLAALDELEEARQRKGFLDAQCTDLTTAIGTLEDAIRRIDRETRAQLQNTFDRVNEGFGALFPRLFGGGQARLILTGDEILDAGVQVMAQPPGKKNSTIHLLSGGEKALTATSLVFSMFQLNPAPFCLLDEVDAPLDDANTERFCAMVREMSAQTQFIFISHNKITMGMAQQLIGVTMQESGVSRVVEVDIEEAMRLSEEVAA